MNQRDTMVRQVSRTFALSIEQLPGQLRDAVSVAYLMFRISDGVEDHPDMSPERKIALLEIWSRVLEGHDPGTAMTHAVDDLGSDDPEVEVIKNTPLVLDWLRELPAPYQAPIIHHVHATTIGMARWQAHGPYTEDELELDDYMHEVAGRVGYLVTDLFSLYSPEINEHKETLMPLSRECGLALQTVNVIRGIRKDYERGWVFIPRTFYERYGLSRETLLSPASLNNAMAVVGLLADKADRHLEHGLRFVTTFPRHEHSIRLALMWPFFFAVRTLAISRHNPDVLTNEAKMTRREVHRIIAETKVFGWSNRWLAQYYARLAAAPVNSDHLPSRLVPADSAVEN